MNSKKLITLLVLTTLLLGLVPVMTVNAVTITGTYEDDGTTVKTDGRKGQTVAVIGSDVTAGKDVELYWDLVQPWSSIDGAGLVNTSKAESSGDYEVWFDIPEATVGTHWLWVRDTNTEETEKISFTVNSYVDASASSGLEGDKVDADLFGFEEEVDVAVALVDDLVGSTATDDLGDTAYGILEYEFTLADTLLLPGTVDLDDGTVIWTDNGDGTLTSADGSGKINYLTGDIELEYDSDPGVRDVLATPAYTYFENVQDDTYIFTSGVPTNDFGTAFKRCTIPDEATEMGYGNYLFLAWDEEGNFDTEDFTIGAVITLDVDEGPVGTVVEIRGSGFEDTETIVDGEVTITIDGASPVTCYIIDVDTGIEIDSSGDFKLEVVIPNVDMDDYDTIEVTDGFTPANTASADFEVTGEASVEVDPEYGVQGTTIDIYGYNFTQIMTRKLY
jgi:hypothetical protein